MSESVNGVCRRNLLLKAIDLLALTAVAGVVGRVGPASATKVTKADFYYQDKPKEGKSCSKCRMFAALGTGKGLCAVVEGEVSPDGWCMAYSPRDN